MEILTLRGLHAFLLLHSWLTSLPGRCTGPSSEQGKLSPEAVLLVSALSPAHGGILGCGWEVGKPALPALSCYHTLYLLPESSCLASVSEETPWGKKAVDLY